MKNIIAITALIGLTACAFNPAKMYYQVTKRGANSVSIQVNKGNMNPESPEVAQMLAHMGKMAVVECQRVGKTRAAVVGEATRTATGYYTWVERDYRCK